MPESRAIGLAGRARGGAAAVRDLPLPRPAERQGPPSAPPAAPRRTRRPGLAFEIPSLGRIALLGVVFAYLGVVLLLPLGALALKAVELGAGSIVRALLEPEALAGLRNSVIVVGVTLLANGVLGVAAAIVLVRHRFPGRQILDLLVDLPLAVSPVMTGLAFLLVFGRGGILQPLLQQLGINIVFTLPAVILVTLFVTLPFTIREVAYVLDELGTTEEEVAATLGASPWQTFWRVTLPNIRHGLNLGLTLTGARALGEFGAALVVGGAISGKTQTATTFIYAAMEERNEAGAFGMAILLALLSIALLFTLRHFKTDRKSE
ncbi:MAG TPA: sulfate ABC transporter permease subunit [Longimicrobiales bacterium]